MRYWKLGFQYTFFLGGRGPNSAHKGLIAVLSRKYFAGKMSWHFSMKEKKTPQHLTVSLPDSTTPDIHSSSFNWIRRVEFVLTKICFFPQSKSQDLCPEWYFPHVLLELQIYHF